MIFLHNCFVIISINKRNLGYIRQSESVSDIFACLLFGIPDRIRSEIVPALQPNSPHLSVPNILTSLSLRWRLTWSLYPQIPGFVVDPVVFCLVCYWMVGLQRHAYHFLMTVLITILTANTASACGGC